MKTPKKNGKAASAEHNPSPEGRGLGGAPGSAFRFPLAMTIDELGPHKEALKRQAIGFYLAPSGVFEGDPKMTRWKQCFRLVAEAWLRLGPQKDGAADRESIIILPDRIVDIYDPEEIQKFGKRARTIFDVAETKRRFSVFAQREVERLDSLLNDQEELLPPVGGAPQPRKTTK